MKIKLVLGMSVLATINMAHAGWFSSKPKEEPKLIPKNYVANDTKIFYSNGATDLKEAEMLRLITRGDTAKVVGLKTVSFILGSGSATGFRKEDLKGSEIKDINDKSRLENPMPLVQQGIVNYINQKAETQAVLKQKEFISLLYIEPNNPSWSLIYDASNKNIKEGYSLNFSVELSRKISQSIVDSKLTFHTVTAQCVYKSEPLSLSDWKANDYEQVLKYKQIAVDTCNQQLLPKLDQFLTPAEVQL